MRTLQFVLKSLGTALAGMVGGLVLAQPVPSVDLAVAELSRCDGQFFTALAAQRARLQALAPLRAGKAAGFEVPDRFHPTRSRVMFAQPVTFQGLQFVGYFDEEMDIPEGMRVYAWGYLVAETVPKTAQRLQALVWDAARLRDVGGAHVRSEIWFHDKPGTGWSKVDSEPGMPKRGTVERVLLIEPYDGERAFIRFGCSIQGHVTEPVLRSVRSDLRP